MVVFKDIDPAILATTGDLHWRARFKNGFGLSIKSGIYSNTDKKRPYEVAIMKGDKVDGKIKNFVTRVKLNKMFKEVQKCQR